MDEVLYCIHTKKKNDSNHKSFPVFYKQKNTFHRLNAFGYLLSPILYLPQANKLPIFYYNCGKTFIEVNITVAHQEFLEREMGQGWDMNVSFSICEQK